MRMPPFQAGRFSAALLLAIALLGLNRPAHAQTAITNITTTVATESGGTFLTGSLSSGTSAASASFSSTNNDLQVSTFNAGGNQ